MESWTAEISVLEKRLEDEVKQREKLEQEKERLVQDYEKSQIERAEERGKHARTWLTLYIAYTVYAAVFPYVIVCLCVCFVI